MEKYVYTTSMGIQKTALIRKIPIRYSFPKEPPSTGGKDDGARGLCEVPTRATKAITTRSEQNTDVNTANSLGIRVHCNMTGSRPLHSLPQAELPAQEDEPAREQQILSLPLWNSDEEGKGHMDDPLRSPYPHNCAETFVTTLLATRRFC